MTPQELKNSILQLAIQGKLVEQREEEGTAEELFVKIQEEKQKLITEKKIKKEKPLPEITEDEKPFDIPESWKWVRFGEIFDITMGQSPKGTSVSENGEGMEFHQGKIYFGVDYLEKSIQKTDEITKIAEPNSILLCVRAPVGVVNIVERKICIGRGLCALTSHDIMYDRFMLFFIRAFQNDFIKKSTGTTFKAITNEVVKNQIFPLPPLAEQKRIVAKIEELMPYIDQYEKAWSKLEQFNKRFPEDMKKSLLQYAIQGKLVEQREEEGTAEELFAKIQEEKQRLIAEKKIKKEKPLPEITEDEKPFDIPESWKWCRLGEIVTILGGKRIPAGRQLTTENTGYKYIRVSDMKDGTVLTDGLLYVPADIYPSIARYIIHKEDVYITVAGTIGRVGKIPYEIDGANLTENADRLVFSILDQNWLIRCLESNIIQSQIVNVTTKVGQPKLAIKRIQELVIPLPPIAEQKRIVEKLEQLLPLCERLK
ncbi:hypothetical protein B5E58_12570 [Tyzzerella sp. An114]|uniref:restriction endonuclease subunit S n=1 Tax=Tyzzerella sp. An114 TaxID=1965545 RepID=UPI000B437376|nr:restriction endonuclease subunit S [Tyzzerella sp. An114]OUQ55256.1 hypothetical protein B5E58_12570 [Tyzzerella sp. An114]